MRLRKNTDMVDEINNAGFSIKEYKYGIVENKKIDKTSKQIILNASLINYYGSKIKDYLSNLIKCELLETFGIDKYSNICVIGLGNREVINDALGPKVLQKLLVTRGLDINPQLCAISPNVYAQTGIESSDFVISLCEHIKPDLTIFIDALATTSLERLTSSFQITNDGIRAGSAKNSKNKKMDRKSLKCDIISIGVPMMIYADQFLKENNGYLKDVILSHCDTKKTLNLISDIISDALNLAIFPQYTKEEIQTMINV